MEFVAKTFFELDQLLQVECFIVNKTVEHILVLLLPVKDQRTEFLPRELVPQLFSLAQTLKNLDFLLDFLVTLGKHFDLNIEFVNLVLVLEDELFIGVPYLALIVLRPQ